MIEYFTVYNIAPEQDVEEDFLEAAEEPRLGHVDRASIGRDETLVDDDRIQKTIPVACTDNYGMRYSRRKRNRLPLWRTHFYDQAKGEPFYYQMVILHYPIRRIADVKAEDETWQDVFFRVCEELRFQLEREEIDRIRAIEEAMQTTEEPVPLLSIEKKIQQAIERLPQMINRLSPEQSFIYNWFMLNPDAKGHINIYGAAGTGKSFLLHTLAYGFLANGIVSVILAPTGVAADSIDGQTIHRFFGLTMDNPFPNLIRLQDFIKVYQNVVFLIDEVSMVSAQLLSSLNASLQQVMLSNREYGNATLICFGDMAQLPPVTVMTEGYFFQAQEQTEAYNFRLQTQLRQEANDHDLRRFLSSIRDNRFDDWVIDYILNHHRPPEEVPTNVIRLFTNKQDTEIQNRRCISALPGRQRHCLAVDSGPTEFLTRETGLLKQLTVKVGIKCLLLHNIDVIAGWTNGTECEVVNIDQENYMFVRRLSDGAGKAIPRITRDVYRTLYSRTQFPLMPSYAATIHKVQSLTIEQGVAVSLSQPFQSAGQFYVACSRVTHHWSKS